MKRRILFSPVSGTDPITGKRDGSLLHICRHYKPDKVYLYLSKEMCEFEDKDHRYTYCLAELGKALNHCFDIEPFKRPEFTDVHIFENNYKEFQKIIDDIAVKEGITENSDVEFLINVSSGTAQMMSALNIIASSSEYRLIPIQVATPAKKMNERLDNKKDYHPELQWESNEDNNAGAPKRCLIAKGEVISIKKELIKKYCDNYAYEAAYTVADEIKNFLDQSALDILKLACCRVQLDHKKIHELEQNIKGERGILVPVFDNGKEILKEQYRIIIEYILVLQTKVKRKEYADFIRGITPVIADLFEICLKEKQGINIKKYCTRSKKNKVVKYCLDWEKIAKNKEINKCLKRRFTEEKNNIVYSSIHLQTLITGLEKDQATKENVEALRSIEENIRNIAAHEIVSITETKIKERTGNTLEEIIKMLKDMVEQAGIKIDYKYWDDYKYMNDRIKEALDKEVELS